MDWLGVTGMVVTLLGGLGVGAFTRRSAKEQNAGQLYSTLTAGQAAELKRLIERVEAMEKAADETKRLNREHMKWDWSLLRILRAALPDEEFPDAPPLDT